MFSNTTSLKKIENLQKRALRCLYNNYLLSYEKLLDKANSSTMNVKRLRFLCVQIYKAINSQNSSFMKQIFELQEPNRSVREKYLLNLNIPNFSQVTFGKKSLRIFGPKTCKSLPYHIKSSKNLESFKTVIKNQDGVNCKRVICKKFQSIFLVLVSLSFFLFLTKIFIHLMSVSSVLISDCIFCKCNLLSL